MVTRFSAEQHHAKDRNSLGPVLRIADLKKRQNKREKSVKVISVIFFSNVFNVLKPHELLNKSPNVLV